MLLLLLLVGAVVLLRSFSSQLSTSSAAPTSTHCRSSARVGRWGRLGFIVPSCGGNLCPNPLHCLFSVSWHYIPSSYVLFWLRTFSLSTIAKQYLGVMWVNSSTDIVNFKKGLEEFKKQLRLLNLYVVEIKMVYPRESSDGRKTMKSSLHFTHHFIYKI